MNLLGTILNLILKVFEAIFEEDVKRRRPPAPPGPPGQRPHPAPGRQAPGRQPPGRPAPGRPAPSQRAPGQEPRPSGPGQNRRPRPMDPENPKSPEEWLREIFGIPEPPKPPPRKPSPQSVLREERLQERIRKQEQQIREQKEHIRAMEQKLRGRARRDDLHKRKDRIGGFELPGTTPLQRAIYARVILGPCKARSKSFHLDI